MNSNRLLTTFSDNVDAQIESNELFFEMLGVGQERNCRYVWVRRDTQTTKVTDKGVTKKVFDNSWVSLGNRRHRKGQISTTKDVMNVMKLEKSPHKTIDYFITPNEFFDWRKSNGLSRLCANYIDIDTKGHTIRTEREQQAIVRDVLETISIKSIPTPTAIITSGSGGLHLYWAYEPVEAFRWRVEVWKDFAAKVSVALGSGDLWKVDYQASVDPTRLMRLPGSKHSKSEREVKAYVHQDTKYDFNHLMDAMDVKHVRPNPLKLIAHNKRSISDSEKPKRPFRSHQSYIDVGKHNIQRWWQKIYEHVRHHCIKNGVASGQRDYAAFILFVAKYNELNDPEKAMGIVREFNDAHIHLTPDELDDYLSTAREAQYRYKKATLAKYLEHNLGMDPMFLFENAKVRLSPAEVKQKQVESASVTAQTKRVKTISAIKLTVLKLVQNGLKVSAESVAMYSKVSKRTVYRYWSEVVENMSVIRSASI
jgi:hypothetical protein